MATCISKSPEETQALGETWGRVARSGLVIGLVGDLGAGKTQVVKGLARGLESRATVLSPTFALVNEYRDGRLPLFHLDLYRLESVAAITGAGLEDYLHGREGVVVVEWIDHWAAPGIALRVRAGGTYRHVTIEAPDPMTRRIVYEDFGS